MAENNNIIIVLGVLIFVLFLFGGAGMMNYSNMMGQTSFFFGMFPFGWLFMILVLAVLVLLILWLAKQLQK